MFAIYNRPEVIAPKNKPCKIQGSNCQCKAGLTYQPTGGFCAPCVAGTWKNAIGPLACIGCAPGTWSNATGIDAAAKCIGCAPGRFFEQAGQTSNVCLGCAAGTWSAAAGIDAAAKCIACTTCASGKVALGTCLSEEGSSKDHSCVGGCSRGFKRNNGQIQTKFLCAKWEGDHEQNQEGPWTCLSRQREEVVTCESCLKGQYQDGTNQDNCKACPEGQVSSEIASFSCTKCPNGKYYSNVNQCDDCPKGYFQDGVGNATECSPCADGSVAPDAGQSTCTSCEQKSYSSNSTTACDVCSDGSVTDTLTRPGGSTCIACEVGRYSSSPTVACIPCTAGKFGVDGWRQDQ
jgi:hypothetical protein